LQTFWIRAAVFCSLFFPARWSLAAGPVYDVTSAADLPDAVIDGVCNTTADNTHPICTLRAAVMEANSFAGPDQVMIKLPAGTYLFTRAIAMPDDVSNGDLNLTGNVRITGKGYDLSVIDANQLDRAILVAPGAVVTLSDLRVQGGRPPQSVTRSGGGNGGGIYNGGSLTLLRCLVRNNQIYNGFGGAGIASFSGSLAIVDSMIRVNGARPESPGIVGGGLLLNSSTTVISRSTVYSNNAYDGGGIRQEAGTLKIVNCTISGNSASDKGAGLSLDSGASATLNNVTLATNSAENSGGGISLVSSSVVLSNSILFNTNASTYNDFFCASSTIASNGFNIIKAAGACAVSGGYGTTAPSLLPLALNGWLTVTHALEAGAGVDSGDLAGCTDENGGPLTVDQRGVKRPIGTRCDLGAFEKEPIGDSEGDGSVKVSDVFYLINFIFAGGAPPHGRANVNGDTSIDVSDVFYLINYLFAGGMPPV
jgi:hypothetical protein